MLRYIIAFLFFAACSVDIFAAIQVVPPTTTSLPYTDATGNPGSIIANVIRYAIMLTGVLAVMAITWGGIGMVLAVGDDEKMKKARKTIIYAFVGAVVAGLAYGIVNAVTRMQL